VPWACEVPSIGCDHRPVVIGRDRRSQPRTDFLLLEIAKLLRLGHLCRRMPFARLARLAAAAAAERRAPDWAGVYDVPSISSGRRAVAIGRAPRSQPRINSLMAEIAKSLRQWHLSPRILSVRSAWLTATVAANPLGAVNQACRSNGPLRANMRGSGYIGVKSTRAAGVGWPRATPCGLLQYSLDGLRNVTITEYESALGGLDDRKFAAFRVAFGGDFATRQQYVDDFVNHPEHQRRLCQLLGLKTEEEKLVEAALVVAKASAGSANLARGSMTTRTAAKNTKLRPLKIAILKALVSVRHQHKFNLLGKGNDQGELERQLGVRFDPEDRHMAAVAFAELEAADLIRPTYDDLIAPGLWVAITDAGRAALDPSRLDSLDEPLGRYDEAPPKKELEQKFKILFSPAQAPVDFAEWISAEGPDVQVAIMFVDIDHFKALNSRLSETVVDETVLPEFQRFLELCVRHRGCAYRQGGEEFVIILPNHTQAEAVVFAERLRATTEGRLFTARSQEVRLTISVGVATFPTDGSTFAEVVHEANLAEHAAKSAGRNRVVVAGAPSV
jgi:diguanylate cyclase (GGDEF)-like protein